MSKYKQLYPQEGLTSEARRWLYPRVLPTLIRENVGMMRTVEKLFVWVQVGTFFKNQSSKLRNFWKCANLNLRFQSSKFNVPTWTWDLCQLELEISKFKVEILCQLELEILKVVCHWGSEEISSSSWHIHPQQFDLVEIMNA
jgi:hypothetical protein